MPLSTFLLVVRLGQCATFDGLVVFFVAPYKFCLCAVPLLGECTTTLRLVARINVRTHPKAYNSADHFNLVVGRLSFAMIDHLCTYALIVPRSPIFFGMVLLVCVPCMWVRLGSDMVYWLQGVLVRMYKR